MARFFQPKKHSTLDTKHQPVTIERLDHQGSGLAFLHKKPLFVDGALPGEEVLIQLTENKSKYARGQLIKVLKPSAERVAPFVRIMRNVVVAIYSILTERDKSITSSKP